ncbi:MAG: phosphoglycerate mutase, partial [Myxococcota bacterium]
GTDSCGHDGDWEGKKAFIERADREFFDGLLDKFDVVVVTGDHSTPSIAKRHTMDPVPILFYHRDIRPDETTKLCEAQAYRGGLGRILGKDLIPIIMDYINKSDMFGE